MKTVPDILREGAAIYEQRNKLYGDSYKRFGNMMSALYPQGVLVKEVDDWNRLGLMMMAVSKISRFAENAGGHLDSAVDLSVYAAMLAELTGEQS